MSMGQPTPAGASSGFIDPSQASPTSGPSAPAAPAQPNPIGQLLQGYGSILQNPAGYASSIAQPYVTAAQHMFGGGQQGQAPATPAPAQTQSAGATPGGAPPQGAPGPIHWVAPPQLPTAPAPVGIPASPNVQSPLAPAYPALSKYQQGFMRSPTTFGFGGG